MATPADTLVELRPRARPWQLECRGSFALKGADGQEVGPRGRRARAIIAYLASHLDEHVSRDRLVELLWPDRGESQARGSLRQSLLEIRRAVPDLIGTDQQHVWIERKRIQIRDPEHLSGDEILFGDLDGITSEFDDWLRCERTGQGSREWSELCAKVEAKLEQGDTQDALPLIERMQRIDPYNEDWLRLAMRAEFLAAHPAGIQTRFNEMKQLLKRDLGVDVSSQTRALRDELLSKLSGSIEPAAEAPPEGRQPAAEHKTRRNRKLRLPWLTTAGVAALLTTLGVSQSAHTASKPTRIAVLPFEASGGVDPAFAEGMSEDLMINFGRSPSLKVLGRSSSFSLSRRNGDPIKIGRQLGVNYFVEGSVRRDGPNMIVTVGLIDSSDSSTVWSEQLRGAPTDAQSMEAGIRASVLKALGAETPAKAPHQARGTAYALYLRARTHLRNRDYKKLPAVLDLTAEAGRIDPDFAPNWAIRAMALSFEAESKKRPPAEAAQIRSEARRSIDRALALDPRNGEANAIRALLAGFNTEEGRRYLDRALKYDPGNSQTVYWAGNAASERGNMALAEQFYERATRMDPLWPRSVGTAASLAIREGDAAKANGFIERLRRTNPKAAAAVETEVALAAGNLSRVVELGLTPELSDDSNIKYMMAEALISMGRIREAALSTEMSPVAFQLYSGTAPPLRLLLEKARQLHGDSRNSFFELAGLRLLEARRYEDIVALYDLEGSNYRWLRDPRNANIESVVRYAPPVTIALAKVGRRTEAARLLLNADKVAAKVMSNGRVPGDTLAKLAEIDALMGRRDDAIAKLEEAERKGWFHYALVPDTTVRDNLAFAMLRQDPRFKALSARMAARLELEKRETKALALLQ
jgi:TolB-like protein/DNA-binding SARP family transcriptional activator